MTTMPSESVEKAKSNERFEVLDSFRGVCAVLVVLFHLGSGHIGTNSFVRGGYMFVDSFFVLSGFVIALSYKDRITDIQSANLFLVRRFFRLWPLHLFLVGLFVVIELASLPTGAPMGARSGRTLPDLIRTLTLTSSFGLDHLSTWNVVTWSISAEWWTYVVFALLLVCFLQRKWTALFVMAAIGAVVCLATHDSIKIVNDWGIMRCFFGFGLGALLAGQWPRVRDQLERVPTGWISAAEVALIVFTVWFVATSKDNAWSFLAPLVFGIVVAVFALGAGPVSRVMRARMIVRIGVLSYSIYMVHMFVQGRFRNVFEYFERHGTDLAPKGLWQQDLMTFVMLVTVILVSELTYRFVEVPGQALGARLTRTGAGKPKPLVLGET